MTFRFSRVVLEAYPDEEHLREALRPLGLTAQMLADAVSSFSSETPRTDGVGYQQIVANELKRHLDKELTGRADLVAASTKVSPNLNEKADLAFGRPDDDRLLLGEIEFRPNFEKDHVKLMIAKRAGRLAAGLLVVSLSRSSLNRRYTTMPEHHKVVRVVRELSPDLALCIIGIEGAFK